MSTSIFVTNRNFNRIVSFNKRNLEHFDIVLKDVEMPSTDTTYYCKVQKLRNSEKKRHIVEFEPIIKSEEFVHHMEVFHCEAPADVEIPLFEGNCDDLPEEAKVCNKVMALWVSSLGLI
jgi:dopamine beta-monooxygenase